MKDKKIILAGVVLVLSLLACRFSRQMVTPAPTDTTRKLQQGELERSYILHIPASVNLKEPVPLVLVFHGGAGNAENAIRMTGFNQIADENGFIVAYPNGTGRLEDKILTWNGGGCCGFAQNNHIDDVGFVRAVIADIETVASINPKQIYATGISNGGIMSYRLACEAADLFAAIAPVSGSLMVSPCNPTEPVSVLHFHGTDDQHILYDGGFGPKSLVNVNFTSVKDSVNFWVGFDQCQNQTTTTPLSDIQLDEWKDCANQTNVILYTILGGQHAWPGSDVPGWIDGDEPTQSISATELIWEFFKLHPKL
ncbi:MAG: PHB depolymerase family esterase [Anaerolineales bacterium]